MAWYFFWTKVAQIEFVDLRPQGQNVFWDFKILLDLPYDSRENNVLFVKIGAKFLDLQLDMSFGPKLPKYSF